jgi:HAD superfamily hydrolase (TIGR01549 family)
MVQEAEKSGSAALIHGIPQPQSVRAVFFDCGYTLLSPHPSVPDIVLSVCAERGLPITRDCLEAHLPAAEAHLRGLVRANPTTWSDDATITATWTSYFTKLLRPCLEVDAAELAAAAHRAQEVFDHSSSYALFPDVLPVLQALRERGLTLGVISDWGIGLGLILRHLNLVHYFAFAVISASLRMAKPDPGLFETALRRADAIPDYAVHIGDSYVLDVLGARAAGITPVLLDRPGKVDPAAMDCLVVRDLYGLLDALEVPRPAPALP